MADQNFRKELEGVLNRYSMENGANVPDFILADYLINCLIAFDSGVNARERWHGRVPGWREEMHQADPGLSNPPPSETIGLSAPLDAPRPPD
jgi:hypothetical protein